MQTEPGVAASAQGQQQRQQLVLHRVTDETCLAALRAAARELANDDARHARFPGPNPVSLDRSHFARLAGEPYYVCEKTDGVRYALVCCRLEAPPALRAARASINVCALLDRALNAFLLPIKHLPRAVYQGTLLDGELAFNRREGRWEYLVFDAVSVSGIPVLNCPLNDRMDAAHCALRVYRAHAGPSDGDPVALRAKTFVPCSKMADFERALPGLREAYEIDGVIFTPALPPVTYGRHLGMFKLKACSRHTVDFLVLGDGVGLGVFDNGAHARVGALAPGQPGPPPPPGSIAECAPAAAATGGSVGGGDEEQLWDLVTLRTDKTTANDMFTYQKTLLNMRENLSLNDVKNVFV